MKSIFTSEQQRGIGETAEKLAMIDQLAKQIDHYSENSLNNDKKSKNKHRGGRHSDAKIQKKSDESSKSAKRALKKYDEGHGCCGDIGCCKYN